MNTAAPFLIDERNPLSTKRLATFMEQVKIPQEARARVLREYIGQLPLDETYGVDFMRWMYAGGSVTTQLFGHLGARTNAVTLAGSLALRDQRPLLNVALEAHAGRGEDPLAIVTPRKERIGLAQYLCMEPCSSHAARLAEVIDVLGLGTSSVQALADKMFSRQVWSRLGNDKAIVNALEFTNSYHYIQCLGVLAARGAVLDRSLWAQPATDALLHFMRSLETHQRPYSPLPQALQVQAVRALAAQGLGRAVRRAEDCPVLMAARRQDFEVLEVLLAQGLRPDRRGRQGTAQALLEREDVSRTPVARCIELLRVATARQAALDCVAEVAAAQRSRPAPA